MKKQEEITKKNGKDGIKRNFLNDLINGKAKNGYIKICNIWI